MSAWDRNLSMSYLNTNPLPADFKWPHRDGGERLVWPVHSVITGYGKWLRETPYFPGLFELCHELIERAPEQHPADWVATELTALREKHPELRGTPGESLAHQLRRLLPLPGQTQLLL